MDYRKTAQEIYEKGGAKENLVSAAHCATRLRLVLADNAKCDAKAVEDIDGVKGVFSASGQLQIILGTGTVNKVYDEFIAVSGLTAATKEEVKAAAAAKQNLFKRAIKTLGDIFVPIIPAIVASGFLMGIMEALNFMVNNDFLSINTSGSIFVFANLFANTAYVFLPILIAYSAAKAFGGNPYLGAVIGMLMIHPDLQNAWTVATQGVLKTQSVWFGLYEVDLVGYQGHVIPVIIAVWVMCFIEKRLHKAVPAMFDLFVTPLVSVFVTGYLTYSVIGPIFVTIENSIIGGIQTLLTLPLGLGSLLMGGLYSTTVVAGIHHMYTVIDMGQLSAYGFTYWLPLASAANMAQGAATLAVALKTKNQKTKSVALPSAFSCFMGITEPAIFGVNLRHFKPFVCGAIGGAAGAMYASIVGLGASGTGVTGLFGLLLCLHSPIHYIIMGAIAIGVSFTLTWMFGYKDAAPAEKKALRSDRPAVSCQPGAVYAPVAGTVIPSEEIPDETFAAGVLGQGVGIQPADGLVVAPFDGEIASVTDTCHAVGITSPDGMELLIHVGVDTVAMNGDGFTCFVQEGQQVKAGDRLIAFDRAKIAAASHPDVVVVLVTNSDDYETLSIQTGACKTLDKVIQV
ncbi:PTS beta-glucoside transporter subunit IIBCA [Pseudoflavonifractor sp. 524-17]|uniref:PTS beta-glucoside transporter subunit IIBCA n=1 Tax=Pseudoflavonifractor sp. 524-17 TaxID=2304577 RepID=UPI00137B5EEA|nr:PTS transporter subunit IIBCA [Pseudoflavonifractor sp. 524-17]NCE65712.1 PTS beta-glucoside transporter subunit IIBCA [Pseudoflavonifractor sp. 524-17]